MISTCQVDTGGTEREKRKGGEKIGTVGKVDLCYLVDARLSGTFCQTKKRCC